MVRGRSAPLDAGNAFSAGIGLGLGLMMVPCIFQRMASSRKIAKTVIVCLKCGGKNPEDFKFCGHCGSALYPKSQVRCTICGSTVPAMKFCEYCGAKLKS